VTYCARLSLPSSLGLIAAHIRVRRCVVAAALGRSGRRMRHRPAPPPPAIGIQV
jgi:hypothetical protein